MKFASFIVSALTIASPATAQTVVPLPPADLGQTNILDGEGGPGGLLEIIAAGSFANRVVDGTGHSLPGDPSQRSAALILHPIYTTRLELLGGWFGGEMLVPLSTVAVNPGSGGSHFATGVGDVTLAPFLQWSPQSGTARALYTRLGLQIVAPLGERQSARPVNVGSGVWQFSPYLAVTKRISKNWEASGRAIFDYSGTETADDAGAAHIRPGDFAILNLSLSRAVDPAWRLGIGGYALQQTARSRVDGVSQGHLQRVFAAGPVMRRQVGHAVLLAAAYAEVGARDRPQGFNANLRFQQPF